MYQDIDLTNCEIILNNIRFNKDVNKFEEITENGYISYEPIIKINKEFCYLMAYILKRGRVGESSFKIEIENPKHIHALEKACDELWLSFEVFRPKFRNKTIISFKGSYPIYLFESLLNEKNLDIYLTLNKPLAEYFINGLKDSCSYNKIKRFVIKERFELFLVSILDKWDKKHTVTWRGLGMVSLKKEIKKNELRRKFREIQQD